MSDDVARTRLSRRAMLLGAGAAAAGAAGLSAGAATAAATPGQGQNGGPLPSPASAPVALAPAAAPEATLMLNTLDFVSVNASPYTYVSPGGVRSTNSDFWNCPVTLPAGSVIHSVSLFINPGGATRPFTLSRYDGSAAAFVLVASGTTTNGTAIETATLDAKDHVAMPSPWAYRIDNLTLDDMAVLYGGVVTYLPAIIPGTLVLHPAPVRVYDSRPGGNADGPLAAGHQRVVRLAGKPSGAGVPPGAQGALLSLTLDSTVGAGFLSVFANGVAWPGTSNVNWYTNGQIVAVTTATFVDQTAEISVLAGGVGSTQFLIDVIGYYP